MIEKTHQRPSLRVESPRPATVDTQKPSPASGPSAPATYSNADKARVDEQTNKVATYTSKTPADRQEAVTLGQIVSQLNDDIAAVSGGRRFDGAGSGGLQQPKKAG
jgi:hypothetical protein